MNRWTKSAKSVTGPQIRIKLRTLNSKINLDNVEWHHWASIIVKNNPTIFWFSWPRGRADDTPEGICDIRLRFVHEKITGRARNSFRGRNPGSWQLVRPESVAKVRIGFLLNVFFVEMHELSGGFLQYVFFLNYQYAHLLVYFYTVCCNFYDFLLFVKLAYFRFLFLFSRRFIKFYFILLISLIWYEHLAECTDNVFRVVLLQLSLNYDFFFFAAKQRRSGKTDLNRNPPRKQQVSVHVAASTLMRVCPLNNRLAFNLISL